MSKSILSLLLPATLPLLWSCSSTPATGDGAPASVSLETPSVESPSTTEQPLLRPVPYVRLTSASVTAPEPTGPQDPAEQETRIQIENWLEQANFYANQGQMEQALKILGSARQALQLLPANDPLHARVIQAADQIERLTGNRVAGVIEGIKDEQQRAMVTRVLNEALARRALAEAQAAEATQDFETALANLERARTLVKLYSSIQDDDLNERRILAEIDRVTEARGEAARKEREQIMIDAQRASDAERRQEEARQQDAIARLMREARARFQSHEYDKAEDALQKVLRRKPEHEGAQELLEIVQRTSVDEEQMELRRRFKIEWVKTFEEIIHSDLPQTDVIMHEDLEHWRKVAARMPLTLGDTDTGELDERTRSIRRHIGASTLMPSEIDDEIETVTEVFETIGKKIGVDIQPGWGEDEAPETGSPKRFLGLVGGSMSVQQWLDNLPLTASRLHYRIKNGVIQIMPREQFLRENMILRMYEVREIVRNVAYYPTKEINLGSSDADAGFEEEPPEAPLIADPDSLPDLIQNNIAPGGWDDGVCEVIAGGTLVVKHTPDVHAQVAELLSGLRGATRMMVDIQSRFLRVEDNFLEDIGIDLRGLGDDSGGAGEPGKGTELFFDDFGDNPGSALDPGPPGTGNDLGIYYNNGSNGDILGRTENLYDIGLGNENVLTNSGGFSVQYTLLDDTQVEAILRAVSKSERLELVTAPRLLVFNTERANMSVTNQVSYVGDFDVEIAQAAAIADPVVDVITDGVILDVTPIISADRRFITLELRPTVATLLRPIPEITTSLGVGSPVTLQLPELEIQRIRTTVTLPDGGTLLLGGQHIAEKQDLQSGIPILSEIPVISFFFSRKGRYTSYRKLMILVKAQIIIPEEHEPDLSR
ncbi:MAG: hypothetical protein H6834_15800 [Planctomycetes bacterium]|nr:hypothetical protein [Planctomycetota bacterium]